MSDFHFLLQEQIPQLMRYASAMTRDADQAVELVEDTVREALDYQRQCKGDVRLWLLTTLHDLRDNPFRQMSLGLPVVSEPEALLTLSDLDHALGALAEEHRAVVLLIGLEGLSHADAASVLRISPAMLGSRLAKARAELRRLMGVDAKGQRSVRAAAA